MKKYSQKSRIGIVLVLLLTSLLFLISCIVDDEESAQPLPVAEYNYSASNNQNAPTTVSFFNTIEIDVTYQWDFGNGETFEGRDPVITYWEEGTYTVTLTATGTAGTEQQSLDIVVGPFSIADEHLIGTWSIIEEEVTTGGETRIYNRPMGWSTLSYESGGYYERVSLIWVEFEQGNWSLENNILSQWPTQGTDDFSSVEILITSFDGEFAEAKLDMSDPDVGNVHVEVLLRKMGPEYFGVGDYPMPSVRDFVDTKWSILQETTNYFAYSPETDEYTRLISSESVTDIPYNFNTFYAGSGIERSLMIDNWISGTYELFFNFVPVNTYTTYWIDEGPEEGDVLILITNNIDGDNIETTSVGFFEEDGETIKFESITSLKRSDGTEATVSEAEWMGQWEVITKSETRDGVAVTQDNSNTPPVGGLLMFHADGSADLGDPNPGSWYNLDPCNFIVASPLGDETLIHILDFNSSTGEVSTFSRWNENGAKWEMILSLVKK